MNQHTLSSFALSLRARFGFVSLLGAALLVGLPASATQAQAQQPGWSATGALGTARSLHTATPLANGKVLVVGGINNRNPCCVNTGVAELYDPATGQWSATGNPSTPRANHIAVRLANGKVLIASGNGDPFSNILNTAEIYDPESGTWSPAGNLNVARQSPRATLLADGRALISGGMVVNGTTASFTNTAEVYDPATNTWTPTSPMNSGRVLHTVTLLPNGKVLAAGGTAANFRPILQGAAEIYDPATNAWTLTGEQTTPRMTHTATLLANGKVLLTGGSSDGANITAGAELYDPATGQWSATGGMTTPRVLHTLTLLPNGKVLAIGGASANTGGLLKSSELYDPATGAWASGAELGAERLNHTATLLPNGKVLAVAGSGVGQLTSAELYDSGAATVASVSAASFVPGAAPESIVAAFGSNLATATQAASSLPLPTTLAGVSVRVRDGAGVEHLAPLFFVAPGQINYQIPAGAAAGQALVAVTSAASLVASGVVEIVSIAPGLFAANANGQGVAAAVALRIRANGAQSFEPIARFDAGQSRFVFTPIDLGPEGDQVFLILYGTGIRFRSAPSAVSVLIGGVGGEVLFADAAPGFVGLDQVNMRLPRSLAGRGEVDVALSVDGRAANAVRVCIR
jgi:uncharacterized protein (TIGR03437 family)